MNVFRLIARVHDSTFDVLYSTDRSQMSLPIVFLNQTHWKEASANTFLLCSPSAASRIAPLKQLPTSVKSLESRALVFVDC